MLLLEQMSGAQQSKKIEVLARAGFKNFEIAELVGTTAGVVKQLLYVARRNKGRKSAAHRKTKKGR